MVRRHDSLADATTRDLKAAILDVAMMLEEQGVNALFVARLREIALALEPPRLEGILTQLEHPRVWPTRAHALWLAERLSVGAHLVAELRGDAEITGSTEVAERAQQWLISLGIDLLAFDPLALAPKRPAGLIEGGGEDGVTEVAGEIAPGDPTSDESGADS